LPRLSSPAMEVGLDLEEKRGRENAIGFLKGEENARK
jgi:hypothetical protein